MTPQVRRGLQLAKHHLRVNVLADYAHTSDHAVAQATGDHLRRYFLSARACAGILERAARRGRRLPSLLEQALTEASLER